MLINDQESCGKKCYYFWFRFEFNYLDFALIFLEFALINSIFTDVYTPVGTRGLRRECVLRIPSVSLKATKWGGFSE